MGWCKHCMKNADIQRDPDGGFLICMSCGRVIDNEIYSTDVTFIKDGGQTRALGRSVKSISAEFSESRERTLAKGREEISDMVYSLNIGGGNDIIDQAHRFYIIAVERNFTRGRRTSHVAASCLYIVCRENKKAYLLIDFSDYLQINVYVLGAVFLQLCQLLRLENHPIVQKLVDPSLFIHRFTERLLGSKNTEVSGTALRIIASMKRDWMQTGRKPSGLCGAALYISALSHGLNYSKSDIVDIVHICEATLTKRLIEFENTESGSLTIEEFNSKAKEHERESYSRPIVGSKESEKVEILCEHKGGAVPHFAHGLCENCYDDFVKISGGLQGGSEPPAFQRCERERMAKVSAEEMAEQSNSVTMPYLMDNNHKHVAKEIEAFSGAYQENGLDFRDSESLGAATGPQIVNEGASNQSHEDEETSNVAGEESESLSDIDDIEVNGYLHSEEEKHYKKIIWEEMNKEYLEEQAAKEAAAAAAKESYEANFQNAEDYLAAQELAAAASAAVAKSRKERQQKRATEAKNAGPARTAAEATRQMLTKKRLSSRINYDVLEKLFDDSTDPDDTVKKRNKLDPIEEEPGKKEVEVENMDSDGDMGQEDDYGEEGDGVPYGDDDLYYDNVEDGYGFDYDDF